MKYFKISQVVPGKGNAWTYYETDDALAVQRILTHIPEVNETKLFASPKIKSLFQPERLIKSDEKEFLELWSKG
jgi:hypothetical protein